MTLKRSTSPCLSDILTLAMTKTSLASAKITKFSGGNVPGAFVIGGIIAASSLRCARLVIGAFVAVPYTPTGIFRALFPSLVYITLLFIQEQHYHKIFTSGPF